MSFKTMLAIVAVTDAASDLNTAVKIASDTGAHLSVLVIGTALPPITSDYPVGTAWLEQRQSEVEALQRVKQEADELCTKSSVAFDSDYLYDDRFILESNIAVRAMYADLVLVGSGVRNDANLRRAVIASVTFDSRTPLLLIPRNGQSTLKPRKVLLAWNSRREAANAAKAALSVLVDAEAVHVVIVDPDSSYFANGGEPGADVAAFLSRHGVNAVIEQLASAGRTTEDVLRQHALELGCDFIVMGAYGHSRLRERIFGGVTASMIEDTPLSVLLAR